jgi:hypothetical protein
MVLKTKEAILSAAEVSLADRNDGWWDEIEETHAFELGQLDADTRLEFKRFVIFLEAGDEEALDQIDVGLIRSTHLGKTLIERVLKKYFRAEET